MLKPHASAFTYHDLKIQRMGRYPTGVRVARVHAGEGFVVEEIARVASTGVGAVLIVAVAERDAIVICLHTNQEPPLVSAAVSRQRFSWKVTGRD